MKHDFESEKEESKQDFEMEVLEKRNGYELEKETLKSNLEKERDEENRKFQMKLEDAKHEHEMNKMEAEHNHDMKKVEMEAKQAKLNTAIKVAEIAAAVIVAPLIDHGCKKTFAHMLCEFEKDYNFTTMAGRSLSGLLKRV